MKITDLKKTDSKLYAKVVKLTAQYSGAKVLHMSSKSMLDGDGNLLLESSKIYTDHERLDKAVITALELARLDKTTAKGDIAGFRASLDMIATFKLFCTGYAAKNGLASHAREHSHCYRRVARAMGRADLYAHMLFGKTQKKLAPVTLGKIIPNSKAHAKTGKLVKAKRATKVTVKS